MSERYVEYREINRVYRPVVTVELGSPSGAFYYPMLVDTGADNIVLPADLMEPWGVAPEDCVLVKGNTLFGQQEGLQYSEARLALPDLWEDRRFLAPVVFSPWRARTPYGLLGREPTLDHITCRFGHADGYGFYMRFR